MTMHVLCDLMRLGFCCIWNESWIVLLVVHWH